MPETDHAICGGIRVESLLARTTLCLRDGETAVLRGQPPQANGGEQLLVLVTLHVIDTFTNP